MAKSTQAHALKSLSYKVQKKIVEVGRLKKQLTEAANLDPVIQQQRRVIAHLSSDVLTQVRVIERNDKTIQNLEARIKDLKADVSSWMTFTPIACVLGVAIGAAGMYGLLTL